VNAYNHGKNWSKTVEKEKIEKKSVAMGKPKIVTYLRW